MIELLPAIIATAIAVPLVVLFVYLRRRYPPLALSGRALVAQNACGVLALAAFSSGLYFLYSDQPGLRWASFAVGSVACIAVVAIALRARWRAGAA
jgi:hypothetical protein